MNKCNCDFLVNTPASVEWEKHYNNCDIVLQDRKKNGEFPNGLPRDSEGFLLCQNKYLDEIPNDYLYHLDMGVGTHDFPKLFGDVKFVCMGGTSKRMKEFAKFASKELNIPIPEGGELVDLTITSNRYAMYKVGPVLAVNHGIGIPTLSVVLQEVIKLLRYSKVKDPILFRLGTSGGVAVEPGSVVVTNLAFNGMLKNTYDLPILGKMVCMPAILDKRLAQEVSSLCDEDDDFTIHLGNTMGADDFYHGQGRTDGPFCEYSMQDKFDFLNKLNAKGIKNIEMEVPCFAALTHKSGIKAADICVTFLDRLKGDQVTIPKTSKTDWETRPMIVAVRYIKAYLKKNGFNY